MCILRCKDSKEYRNSQGFGAEKWVRGVLALENGR